MNKVFAIGNPLLGDDAIALHLVKTLSQNTNLTEHMSFFLAETDCLYALEVIQPNDFIIILDSCYFSNTLGNLTCLSLEECFIASYVSTHSFNLLSELKLYFPQISGFFIGIEVHDLRPSLSLSTDLTRLLPKLHLDLTKLLLSLVHSHQKSNQQIRGN